MQGLNGIPPRNGTKTETIDLNCVAYKHCRIGIRHKWEWIVQKVWVKVRESGSEWSIQNENRMCGMQARANRWRIRVLQQDHKWIGMNEWGGCKTETEPYINTAINIRNDDGNNIMSLLLEIIRLHRKRMTKIIVNINFGIDRETLSVLRLLQWIVREWHVNSYPKCLYVRMLCINLFVECLMEFDSAQAVTIRYYTRYCYDLARRHYVWDEFANRQNGGQDMNVKRILMHICVSFGFWLLGTGYYGIKRKYASPAWKFLKCHFILYSRH